MIVETRVCDGMLFYLSQKNLQITYCEVCDARQQRLCEANYGGV